LPCGRFCVHKSNQIKTLTWSVENLISTEFAAAKWERVNLPDPEILAVDIMENLEGALELFRTINEKLK
jgi:hypothetical protein